MKSSSNAISVYLVGALETVIQETIAKLLESRVNVVRCQNGYFDSEQEAFNNIINSNTKIVNLNPA